MAIWVLSDLSHCLRAGWSVRELRRQIDTLYYERTALSTDKETLEGQALAKTERDPPSFPIRDPYVFEFLGLKPAEVMGESDLEDALLDKLQEFLLELGHGFCFEARQKRLLIGNTYNFVDLVFYHRVLKCHVLVELKVDKFTHEHIGQLNTYVSWYTDNEMTEGDNPPARRLWSAERSRLKQEATRLLPSFRGDPVPRNIAHIVCAKLSGPQLSQRSG